MLSARLINYNFLAPVYAIKLLEISLFLFFNMTFPAKEVRKANFSPAEISILTETFEGNNKKSQEEQVLGRDNRGRKRRRRDR